MNKPTSARHSWNRTVIGSGVTSALGGFCYETTVILPGFLAVLGIPAAVLGIIEGIADTVATWRALPSWSRASSPTNWAIASCWCWSHTGRHRWARHSSPWLWTGPCCRVVSWFGMGQRGPLRDATVIQSITPEPRGWAFGFHRTMDTIGAVPGPLVGVALLRWAERGCTTDTMHFAARLVDVRHQPRLEPDDHSACSANRKLSLTFHLAWSCGVGRF